ncbi:MAG: hypothetical protein JO033_27195 [Acidobacteriaceae bacterium]|nr:hypothetical protein [Acidobacteriaceae bacterium]MBV9502796.1 hypothetical protein [Acidobacteriaceae bacterium]
MRKLSIFIATASVMLGRPDEHGLSPVHERSIETQKQGRFADAGGSSAMLISHTIGQRRTDAVPALI